MCLLLKCSVDATWKNKSDFIQNSLLAPCICFSCKLFCYTINKQNIEMQNISFNNITVCPCFYCRIKKQSVHFH